MPIVSVSRLGRVHPPDSTAVEESVKPLVRLFGFFDSNGISGAFRFLEVDFQTHGWNHRPAEQSVGFLFRHEAGESLN